MLDCYFSLDRKEELLTLSCSILARRTSNVSSAHFLATSSSSATRILSKRMSMDIDQSSKPTAN